MSEKDEKDESVAEQASESLEKNDEAAAAADAGAPQATETVEGTASAQAKGEEPPVDAKAADALKKDEHEAQGEENLVAEADRPNVGIIGLVTFAIVVTVVVVVIGVYEFFGETFRGEIERKQLAVENPALRELHAEEQAKLSKYQWVDQKKGVVRMPKDRAKELVLADYAKMAAYVPGEASPAGSASAEPAGSAAPAGSGSAAPASSEAVPAGSASAVPSTSASVAPSASAAPSASTHAAPSASASGKPAKPGKPAASGGK